MGLFEKLGRRVGKLEQEAKDAKQSNTEAAWACGDCDATFQEAPEYCPDCGSEAIVERDDDG